MDMSLHLVLKDKTVIDIEESGLSGHIVVRCDNSEEFNSIWEKLTPEAVEEYTIEKNGVVVQSVVNGQLTGTQTVTNYDDTLTCHFYLKGDLVAQSDEYSEVGRILMGEE
jgi:hypothetical protein